MYVYRLLKMQIKHLALHLDFWKKGLSLTQQTTAPSFKLMCSLKLKCVWAMFNVCIV